MTAYHKHNYNNRNVRIVRLEAAQILLRHLNSLSSEVRSRESTLYTYAALTWLINGLHNRPPSDQTGRAVARMALPLTSDLGHEDRLLFGFEADDSERRPFCPGGMMFLRRMVFPPASDSARLAVKRSRTLPDVAFRHMFGKSMQDLQLEMDPIFSLQNKPTRPPKRFAVSRKMSALRNPPENEEDTLPESFRDLDGIAVAQAQMSQWGPDVQQMHEPLSDNEERNVAHEALDIWRQFASDIIQKIGNPAGAKGSALEDSYCVLPPSERLDITVEQLKDSESCLSNASKTKVGCQHLTTSSLRQTICLAAFASALQQNAILSQLDTSHEIYSAR